LLIRGQGGAVERERTGKQMKYLDIFPNRDNESRVSIGRSRDKFALG
jgi:hypothetical protein